MANYSELSLSEEVYLGKRDLRERHGSSGLHNEISFPDV